MSDIKKIENINRLSNELESLIAISSDNCSPLLIQELQCRIDKVIDTFNKDVKEMLKTSFQKYGKKMDRCNEILNNKQMVDENADEFEEKDIIPPRFIEKHEKKVRNSI